MKRLLTGTLVGLAASLMWVNTNALTIQLDYSYDSLGFFSGANLFRRDIMRAAADVFEERITDQLTAIEDYQDGQSDFDFMTEIIRPDTGEIVLGPSEVANDTVVVSIVPRNVPPP